MGSNSIQCSVCKCWVHHGTKRSTKIKGPLPKKIADIERFVCVVCKGDLVVNDKPVNINFCNESLELVDKLYATWEIPSPLVVGLRQQQ